MIDPYLPDNLFEEEEEDEAPRIMYLRCQLCTICIGPGYYRQEVWFWPEKKKLLCWGCGDDRMDRGAYQVLSAQELAATNGGKGLIAALRAKGVKK